MIIKQEILNTVSMLIDKQTRKGLKKYGETLEQCNLNSYNWQNMITEELIDALQYQQKEITILNDEIETLATAYNNANKEILTLKNKLYRRD